ncbi:YadA C-terminal domain-containing protein [Sneathia sanguinegens]|uniref:YadA C-terminal domain-containing protein n=1 Tax=Sneathia sanguinegens TaxID=40543 RepID=UPI0023F8D79B|nr:YadA C-terminal domain-containing protein [Sneathia sanguinegens]
MKKKVALLLFLLQILAFGNQLLDGNHQGGSTPGKGGPQTPHNAGLNDATKGYIDEEFKKMNLKNIEMQEAEKEKSGIYDGTSAAVAIANLGMANSSFKYSHQISGAYGYYGKNHAFALGVSGVSPDDRVTYRLSSSVTHKGNFSVGLGLGVQFGKYKNNSIDSMKKEIKDLNNEVSDLKEQIKQLKELINKK